MAKNNSEMSGWVGWVGFASFMMLLAGVFALLAGFVALFKDTAVYHSATNTVWVLSYTQWGWAHIILGFLAILAAGSLMAGHMFGRVIAVWVALLSAFANMAFVPVYPVWSIMVIVVDILVIYAVTVHGGELKE
jgi:hypothetical protein